MELPKDFRATAYLDKKQSVVWIKDFTITFNFKGP